jgi:hypothetical protein
MTAAYISFSNRALHDRVGDDLCPTALFEEEPLEQIRGADRPPMPEREA